MRLNYMLTFTKFLKLNLVVRFMFLQAKGLEFSDVFIVNFFSDSPVRDQWRLLNTHLEELEEKLYFPQTAETHAALAARNETMNQSIPFEAKKAELLAEELKHLYTAITRAKNNVGFCSPCLS